MLQGKENSLLTTFKNLHLSPNKLMQRPCIRQDPELITEHQTQQQQLNILP